MDRYKIIFHTGEEKIIRAEGPVDGLRETFPEFKWKFGIKHWAIYPPTFTYSDRSGNWAKIVVIEENQS